MSGRHAGRLRAGISSIIAALWIGIPLEAVMLKVAGDMSGFSLLAIPFFITAGAIMAVGGMAERLVNLAKVFVGFIRSGMALVNILDRPCLAASRDPRSPTRRRWDR